MPTSLLKYACAHTSLAFSGGLLSSQTLLDRTSGDRVDTLARVTSTLHLLVLSGDLANWHVGCCKGNRVIHELLRATCLGSWFSSVVPRSSHSAWSWAMGKKPSLRLWTNMSTKCHVWWSDRRSTAEADSFLQHHIWGPIGLEWPLSRSPVLRGPGTGSRLGLIKRSWHNEGRD